MKGGQRRFFVILPIVAEFLIILTLIFCLRNGIFVHAMKVMGLYFIPPAGKETVIPLGVMHYDLNPFLVGLLIAQIDIVSAVFLQYNMELMMDIPYLGKWMKGFENKNREYFKKKKWMRKLAFMLTILFVAFPSRGSGGIGGVIFGRAIGLDGKRTTLCVVIGTIIGCTGIALLADSIDGLIPSEYTIFLILGLAVFLAGWSISKKIYLATNGK